MCSKSAVAASVSNTSAKFRAHCSGRSDCRSSLGSVFPQAVDPAPSEPPEQVALDSSHVKAHRCASGGNGWPAPWASGLFHMVWTTCENVSGLSAEPLAKMEIRAS